MTKAERARYLAVRAPYLERINAMGMQACMGITQTGKPLYDEELLAERGEVIRAMRAAEKEAGLKVGW